MIRTAVIMAGGSGERFWPLSRKNKPKQLLNLGKSEFTMIEESVMRASKVIDPKNIFIITGEHLVTPIKDVLKLIPEENILAEPSKRNTAPCLALSVALIMKKYGNPKDISMAVLTSDHIMETDEQFVDTVSDAISYVENNNVIATIAISPSRPETGYGYVELGEKKSVNNAEIFKVNKFKEKPNFEIAQSYIQAGNYLWNSGMFFWRLDTFIEQMSKHLPAVGTNIIELSKTDDIPAIFNQFPNISIDFGLMEKADEVVCVKALFSWDDLGDLNSLERTKLKDKNGNIRIGKNVMISCNNCIIFNESTNNKISLNALSVSNLVIVITDDAVLVADKNDVQRVKEIVEEYRLQKWEEYL